MAEGAIETYLQVINKQFKFHATWPPGSLVALGDIGVIRDGAFVKTSSLKAKGFRFRRERREAPSMRFSSRAGVSFEGSIRGATDTVVTAIGKLDAGLKITFKKEGALVFVLDPARDDMIEDVDDLSEWMQSQYATKLKEDQVVITHIRQASSGVIAMASAGGAQVQLKTDATIGKGKLDIADVKGKLELVTSTDTEFVSVPRGKSGTTPLYRMLHYHPDRPGFVPGWLPWRRGDHQVEFAYAQRMSGNVALYPAPEALRAAEALHFGD